MTFSSAIISIRTVQEGESVGYTPTGWLIEPRKLPQLQLAMAMATLGGTQWYPCTYSR